MTVQELKEQLEKFPPTAEVIIVELKGSHARMISPCRCSDTLTDTGKVAILCNEELGNRKEWV